MPIQDTKQPAVLLCCAVLCCVWGSECQGTGVVMTAGMTAGRSSHHHPILQTTHGYQLLQLVAGQGCQELIRGLLLLLLLSRVLTCIYLCQPPTQVLQALLTALLVLDLRSGLLRQHKQPSRLFLPVFQLQDKDAAVKRGHHHEFTPDWPLGPPVPGGIACCTVSM
jgi:hypothetical protein